MEGKVYSGVATMRRLPKFECLFFKHEVILWSSFANESCEFSEPTLVSLLLVAIPQAVGSCVCFCVGGGGGLRICVCMFVCVCVCVRVCVCASGKHTDCKHLTYTQRDREITAFVHVRVACVWVYECTCVCVYMRTLLTRPHDSTVMSHMSESWRI